MGSCSVARGLSPVPCDDLDGRMGAGRGLMREGVYLIHRADSHKQKLASHKAIMLQLKTTQHNTVQSKTKTQEHPSSMTCCLISWLWRHSSSKSGSVSCSFVSDSL